MKTYNLPNFTNPLEPLSTHVRGFNVNLISKTISVEIALCLDKNVFVHLSEPVPFDGDWDKINVETMMSYELAKYEVK
jgi:hypothetical protein